MLLNMTSKNLLLCQKYKWPYFISLYGNFVRSDFHNSTEFIIIKH